MGKNILDNNIALDLLKVPGEGRGVHLKNDEEYVLKELGKGALEKVEDEWKKAGIDFHYKDIKNTEFYPAGYRAISLLAIKQALGWDDEKLKEMFGAAVGASLIVRVFMRFFYSIKKAIDAAPKLWREYWTKGELVVTEYNSDEKKVIVQIRDFDLHPVDCVAMEGFIGAMVKLINGAKYVSCKETKCSFRDPNEKHHEYVAEWRDNKLK